MHRLLFTFEFYSFINCIGYCFQIKKDAVKDFLDCFLNWLITLNFLFFIDGFEKRRAVIFMDNKEMLIKYYEYWETFRFLEYSICLSSFLIIMSVAIALSLIKTEEP